MSTGQRQENDNVIELLHRWVGGDGKEARQALIQGFKKEHPEVEINEKSPENLTLEVKSRILKANPPSTWHIWPGKNLQPFLETNVLRDLSESVWTKDMEENYLEGPKRAAKPDGNYVAVPVNIHRINNLFYNIDVVKEVGINPERISSPTQLIEAMEQVEDSGFVGMSKSTKSLWPLLQLWATILLGEFGSENYREITEGKVEKNSDVIKKSLRITKEFRKYFPEDSPYISWTEANKKLVEGEAAFIHQGDWAAGMYREENSEFGKDWGQTAFPGTDGLYAMNMDSFPIPKNSPSPQTAEKFLRYVGTPDAQKRFNVHKGSIPPRVDMSKRDFPPFLRKQMDDFANSNSQPGSIAHGLAVTPETLIELKTAVSVLVRSWDVDKAYPKFVSALKQG